MSDEMRKLINLVESALGPKPDVLVCRWYSNRLDKSGSFAQIGLGYKDTNIRLFANNVEALLEVEIYSSGQFSNPDEAFYNATESEMHVMVQLVNGHSLAVDVDVDPAIVTTDIIRILGKSKSSEYGSEYMNALKEIKFESCKQVEHGNRPAILISFNGSRNFLRSCGMMLDADYNNSGPPSADVSKRRENKNVK